MKTIEYVADPDDRVGFRCRDTSGDGSTECTRRRGHPSDTKVIKKISKDEETTIEFNHRGQKIGSWVTW